MRKDGRSWDEIRPVRMIPGFVDYPEGSVLIEMGGTRVLCNATVESFVPRWRQGSGAGWITAEYAMLPRSTHRRTRRETLRPRGRSQEIKRLIGRSLRAAVDLESIGERQIILDCDVLQADGGTRTAAITAGYVALALALGGLEKEGLIEPGVLAPDSTQGLAPGSTRGLANQVAAISLGVVDGQLLLDLCYEEDSAATADFNVVMTGAGQLVEIQGTAEGATFDRKVMDSVLDLAEQAIGQLVILQRQVLNDVGEAV